MLTEEEWVATTNRLLLLDEAGHDRAVLRSDRAALLSRLARAEALLEEWSAASEAWQKSIDAAQPFDQRHQIRHAAAVRLHEAEKAARTHLASARRAGKERGC